MAKSPAMELFVKGAAEKILDDFVFYGKTIREWALLICSGDAVEVVRCKVCWKRGNEKECPMCFEVVTEFDEGDGYMVNDYITKDRTTDDGFCHCGERREGA